MPEEKVIEAYVPNTGAIPSPDDYRDRMAAQSVYDKMSADLAAGTLPYQFETDIAALGEALDQNKTSACVSHAWALVMKYWWWKKTGELVDFSPRYLHIMSRQDWIPVDGGRVPRDVCKVSAKNGCCTTRLLPNDTENLTHAEYGNPAVLTAEMHAEAAKYKIPGYIRIPDNSVSDFRRAIQQLGLVSGLFSISDAFWTAEDGTVTWAANRIDPLRIKPSTSNHQMVVRGWIDTMNIVRNSWSKLWANNGEAKYKAGSWLPFIWEGWAIAEVPADLKAFLSALPAPADFHYQWNTDLKAGMAPNDDIKMAQIFFMMHGFLGIVPPEQLGYYGPLTAKAVQKYQTYKKISPTAPNSIGPKTRAAMNADAAL